MADGVSDMRIRAKISSGYITILLLLIIQSAVTIYFVDETKRNVIGSVQNEFYTGLEFNRIAEKSQQLRRYEKEYFIYVADLEKRRKYYQEWLFAVESLKENIQEIVDNSEGIWSDQDSLQAKEWLAAQQFYVDSFQSITSRVEAGEIQDTLSANELIKDGKNRFRPVIDGSSRAGDLKYKEAEKSVERISDDFFTLEVIILGAIILSIFVAMFFIIVLPRMLTKPIEELTAAATRMSMGDLGQRIVSGNTTLEFRLLAETLERMRISQSLLLKKTAPRR